MMKNFLKILKFSIKMNKTQSEDILKNQKTQKSDEILISNQTYLFNHPIKTASNISEDSIEF